MCWAGHLDIPRGTPRMDSRQMVRKVLEVVFHDPVEGDILMDTPETES